MARPRTSAPVVGQRRLIVSPLGLWSASAPIAAARDANPVPRVKKRLIARRTGLSPASRAFVPVLVGYSARRLAKDMGLAWTSVQRRPADEVRVRFLRADPPLEHDTARAGDRQAVAVRLRLGRLRRHPVVRAMVVDELLKVGQKAHGRRIASRSWAPQVLSRFVLGSPGFCTL